LFFGDWFGKPGNILKHLHGHASGFIPANAAKDAIEVAFKNFEELSSFSEVLHGKVKVYALAER
jgi:hypothetical protein